MRWLFAALTAVVGAGPVSAERLKCNSTCLEGIAESYRTAHLAHDLTGAAFAARVRFTENNVQMDLHDGTWDTVTREVGPALTVSDPVTDNVGVFTSIMQGNVPGFLAIRLKVNDRRITEVEHVVATQRYLAPPVSLGDLERFAPTPEMELQSEPPQRMSRAYLIRLAEGYFSTLQKNVRGIVMARAFIDNKGRLNRYRLKDGTDMRSPYQEPQTWGLLEISRLGRGRLRASKRSSYRCPTTCARPGR